MTEQSKQILGWLKSHLETTPIDEVVSGLRDANKGVVGGISMITDPQKHLEETLEKCLEVVAPFVVTKVYEFAFTDCHYEAGPVTISIHRTREGAESALRNHRTKYIMEECAGLELVEDHIESCIWTIYETELKP